MIVSNKQLRSLLGSDDYVSIHPSATGADLSASRVKTYPSYEYLPYYYANSFAQTASSGNFSPSATSRNINWKCEGKYVPERFPEKSEEHVARCVSENGGSSSGLNRSPIMLHGCSCSPRQLISISIDREQFAGITEESVENYKFCGRSGVALYLIGIVDRVVSSPRSGSLLR